MKKIYTLLTSSFLCCLTANAQLTLTKAGNEPVVGDVVMNADYDSTTAIPKSAGSSQNWNFSSLTAGSFTEVITYTTVASTPSAGLFAGANLAALRGSNNWEYWNTQPASLSYVGSVDASAATVFSNLGVWENWPTSFGNTNSDPFSATETGSTYTNTWAGNVTLSASGSGTVVLPNGNIHPNCLQVIRTISVNVTGTQPSTMVVRQYEYWSSLTKFPILTVDYNAKTTGSGTTKQVFISVSTAGLLTGIPKVEPEKTTNVMIYPNPTRDILNVFLPGNNTAEKIEIYDVCGKMVLNHQDTGSVNVSNLDNGVYLIKAAGTTYSVQKLFIKAN